MSECRQPIAWVADDGHLRELAGQWLQLPWLAVDTEFMRTDTFYPVPALIQINDGSTNYLIDPLALSDLAPLAEVIASPGVQKVLHSCSEDLEVFQVLLQCQPVNLLDTQIAAAFCGYGFSVGYANLVAAALGVPLPKDETRSNWLQRPLTSAQQRYAALDVEYLYQLTLKLKQQLAELGREQWVVEESDQVRQAFVEGQNPANASNRFKGAWRLDERQLAALVELASWRDRTAQAQNAVRGQILRDKSLFAIAEMLPTHVAQLRKVPEMPEKTIRRYGEILIEMIDEVRAVPEAELPPRLPRPPGTAQQAQIGALREQLALVGDQLKIAPEYLARRRDLEFMVRARQQGLTGDALFPASLTGWRARLVKPALEIALEAKRLDGPHPESGAG